MTRLLRFGVASAAVAALVFVPLAQGHARVVLTLQVNYSYEGDITVTLPNGQAVGTKSGTPTVIPAGYYTVELTQPGCVDTPAFILQGPGVNILDDMEAGEIVTDARAANFQPNSTYTWRSGSINPPVVFTFVTNGDVIGTPPPPSQTGPGTRSKNKETNSDVVNSGKTSLRGTLAGSVSAGKVSLAFKGKAVSSLRAGRYAINVTDASKSDSFMLESSTHRLVGLTTGTFVGKHSSTLALTAGKWYFLDGAGGKKTAFTVTR